MSNMYDGAKTWNCFVGCKFDCTYCRPSFQAQAKRQKHNCLNCYAYEPHVHPERLNKIPKADIIFACASGDISFCPRSWLKEILFKVAWADDRTFYLQTKDPDCLADVVLPDNVIVVTTLETNIDQGYREYVSKTAPLPSKRRMDFENLTHPRKVVTIEPIMEFDEEFFQYGIRLLHPEYVWIGFNSRPKQVQLPEPSEDKVQRLVNALVKAGIKVKGKTLRGVTIPPPTSGGRKGGE